MENQKKPFYKRAWFIVLVIVVGLGIIGSFGNKNKAEDNTEVTPVLEETAGVQKETTIAETTEQETTTTKVKETTVATTTAPAVPKEYISALNKAETYSEIMNMSKQGIYDQLTSEYGEQFTPEAAQYAIDNMSADWNYNALQKAISYRDTMDMSPAAIHDQLTSEYGEKFTESQADYAIEHLDEY